MKNQLKGDLVTGSITGSMLRFAFPLMLGNLLQQCYNIADTLIVGRVLGAGALAAVGSSYALIVFITSIFIGLSMGCSAVFSMQYGARDWNGLQRSIFSAMLIVGGVTLLLNMGAILFLSPVIRLLQTPFEIEQMAYTYLFIVFLGMIPVSVYNFYANLLRSIGNSVVPLAFLVVSVVLNIVLDLLLMLVFHMGVKGAALATVIAQVVGAVELYVYTRIHFPELRLKGAYLRIEGSFYIGIGYLFLLYGFYRAVALPSMSVVLTVVSLGTRVVLAYALATLPAVGYTGIWWSVPIGWALADGIGVWYYRKIRKQLLPI